MDRVAGFNRVYRKYLGVWVNPVDRNQTLAVMMYGDSNLKAAKEVHIQSLINIAS